MPLIDHFHPPLLNRPPSWESFHSFWAVAIAEHLNQLLPRRYIATVTTHLGSEVEADVAEFESPFEPEDEPRNGPGGGVAMVGGLTSFGAGSWDQTPWDKLIPVEMSGQANSPGRGTYSGLNFKITVPKAAEDHPIWRIVDDPARNRQILAGMPFFNGSNLVERLKPAHRRILPSIMTRKNFLTAKHGGVYNLKGYQCLS